MMLKVAKLGIAIAAVLTWIVPAAYAGVPDTNNSFYVPQAGPVGTPLEGLSSPNPSYRFFRGCPNNDGGSSFPNNARIKVVVRDVNGNGIAGVAAADICLLFNGGTPAQGFSGVGADSVEANATLNNGGPGAPLCPDVRCVQADDQTDATGTTYITFTGATPGSPGVGTRNPFRKWGHYDTEIPVFVLGFKLQGRITTASPNGTYTLQIKNYDHTGGTGVGAAGEQVGAPDWNAVALNVGGAINPFTWWRDFDSTGGPIAVADFNVVSAHLSHNCTFPLNP